MEVERACAGALEQVIDGTAARVGKATRLWPDVASCRTICSQIDRMKGMKGQVAADMRCGNRTLWMPGVVESLGIGVSPVAVRPWKSHC